MCTTTCSVRKSPRKSSCLQPRSVELALKSLTQMKVFLCMMRCSHFARLSSKSTDWAAYVEPMKSSPSFSVIDTKTQLSPVKRWVMTILTFLSTTWSEFLFEVKIFQFFGKMDNVPFLLKWASCNRPMSMSFLSCGFWHYHFLQCCDLSLSAGILIGLMEEECVIRRWKRYSDMCYWDLLVKT